MATPEPDAHTASRFIPMKPVVLHILLALVEQDCHGYGLIQAVRERTQGRLKIHTGPLYRHLQRLLSDGFIEEAPAGNTGEPVDPRRGTNYRLTRLGRTAAALEMERLSDVVALGRSLDLLSSQ